MFTSLQSGQARNTAQDGRHSYRRGKRWQRKKVYEVQQDDTVDASLEDEELYLFFFLLSHSTHYLDMPMKGKAGTRWYVDVKFNTVTN